MSDKIKMNDTKYTYISLLNIISAVAVVILHANGSFWNYRADISWAINNIVECVFYFAVPIFFMLTGVNLIDYLDKYDTKTFLKKRFKKNFIPFLAWSLLALSLSLVKNPTLLKTLTFESVFNGIFNTEYMYIYWFFIPLSCIYLSIPLLACVEKNKRINIFKFISVVAFFFNILIPFLVQLVNFFGHINIKWTFKIPILGEYLFYVVVGYLLHKITLQKKTRILIYIFSILGLLLHIVGTYYLSSKQGNISSFFKGYTNLPCVIYSVGVFVFIKYLTTKIKIEKSEKIILKLQKYTFPIYLMHMFVFKITSFVLLKLNISDNSQLYVILLTLFTIPICILVTFIMRKIPVIRNIVP